MEKCFGEKLKQILMEHCDPDDSFDRGKAHKAILDLVKSIVPEKISEKLDFGAGFNECRGQILTKLTKQD